MKFTFFDDEDWSLFKRTMAVVFLHDWCWHSFFAYIIQVFINSHEKFLSFWVFFLSTLLILKIYFQELFTAFYFMFFRDLSVLFLKFFFLIFSLTREDF